MLTPYDGLGTRFAAVSWGHRMALDCFDAEALTAFFADHVDQAPESILGGPDPRCL